MEVPSTTKCRSFVHSLLKLLRSSVSSPFSFLYMYIYIYIYIYIYTFDYYIHLIQSDIAPHRCGSGGIILYSPADMEGHVGKVSGFIILFVYFYFCSLYFISNFLFLI